MEILELRINGKLEEITITKSGDGTLLYSIDNKRINLSDVITTKENLEELLSVSRYLEKDCKDAIFLETCMIVIPENNNASGE